MKIHPHPITDQRLGCRHASKLGLERCRGSLESSRIEKTSLSERLDAFHTLLALATMNACVVFQTAEGVLERNLQFGTEFDDLILVEREEGCL